MRADTPVASRSHSALLLSSSASGISSGSTPGKGTAGQGERVSQAEDRQERHRHIQRYKQKTAGVLPAAEHGCAKVHVQAARRCMPPVKCSTMQSARHSQHRMVRTRVVGGARKLLLQQHCLLQQLARTGALAGSAHGQRACGSRRGRQAGWVRAWRLRRWRAGWSTQPQHPGPTHQDH